MRGRNCAQLRRVLTIIISIGFVLSNASYAMSDFVFEGHSSEEANHPDKKLGSDGGILRDSIGNAGADVDSKVRTNDIGVEGLRSRLGSNLHRGLLLDSDEYGDTLSFSIEPISMSEVEVLGSAYTRIDDSELGTTSEIGLPELPVIRRIVAVPHDGDVSLRILNARYQYYGQAKVYPFQEPLIEGQETGEFVIDENFYAKDAFYPKNVADIQMIGIIRGVRVAMLQVNPVRYNPHLGSIEMCTSIQLRLQYQTSFRESFGSAHPGKASPAFEDFLRETILNYGSLEGFYESGERANYLIITGDSFYSSTVPIAQWKEAKGYEVKIVNLSSIGSSDVDIRDYIYDAYHNWELAPSFVLLVGDVEYLPTHYGIYHEYEKNYTATDLFYATVDGSDYLPDVHVGRISVKTSLEADNAISKIVDYEKNPYVAERDWYRSAVVVSDQQSGRPFEETSNYVANFLASRGYSVNRVYYSMGGDTSDISKYVNSGSLFVNYRGHGDNTMWYRPRFDNSDVGALTNGRKLPVVMAPTCRSAWYDHPTITSFGETWVKAANKGSVGYFGSSRVSYSYFNDELDKGVYWAMFNDNLGAFGQVANKAKIYMMEEFGYYDSTTQLQFEMYNVLGDPELRIWITTPPLPDDVGTDTIDSLMNQGKYLKGPRSIDSTIKNHGGSLSNSFNVSAEVKEMAIQTSTIFSDDMEGYTNPDRDGWQLDEWERDVGEWESGTPTNVGPSTAHSGSNCWGTDLDGNYDNYGVTVFNGFVVDQGFFVDAYGRNDFLDIPAQAGDRIFINISWTSGADVDFFLYKPSDVMNHSITGGNHIASGISASTVYESIDYTTTLSDGGGIYKLRVNLFSGGNTAYSIDEITVDNVTYTGSDYPNALKRVDDESADYPEITNHYFWAYADFSTYFLEYTFDYDIDIWLYDPDGDVRTSNTLDNDGYWYGSFEADEYGLWRVRLMGYGPDGSIDSYTLSVYHPDHSALLVSPVIDLSDPNIISSEVRFWHWYNFEGNFDYAYFLVGTVDLVWLGGRYFTGDNSEIGWTEEIASLDMFAGLKIRLAFSLSTDSSVTRAGWYVDDINVTVTSRVQSTLLSDDMEVVPSGWTASGFWHHVEDGVDPYNNSHSSTHSWWYGQDSTGDYDNGVANSGNLASSHIDLTDAVTATLTFWRWFETENVTDWDKKMVQISVDNGTWTDIHQVTTNPSEWVEERVDLTLFVGNWIRLRFYFDSVDEFDNNYRGWYIDDVNVFVAMEVTVFGPVLRTVAPMAHNETTQLNWSYDFQNETYYRVIVTTLLNGDMDAENDQRDVVIRVVGYLPPILLVDDAWRSEAMYFKASLDANGYDYDFSYPVRDQSWHSVMSQYEVIVWMTHGALSNTDQDNLRKYLDGGGGLFISGEDIGYYMVQSGMGASFYHNYLHATYLRDDTDSTQIVGVTYDPISDGLPTLDIRGLWPSEIATRDDFSSVVFTYADDGNASVKSYTGTYRTVYFACEFFEGPEPLTIKSTIMDRIIQWLRMPNQPVQIIYSEPFGDPTINEGENARFNITTIDLDGTKPMIQWYLNGTLVGNEDAYTYYSDYDSAGTHVINVTVSDGQSTDYREWLLTVVNVNRPPSITWYSPTFNPTINEGEDITFSVTVSDPDPEPVAIEWFLDGVHVQNGSSFLFVADYDSAGIYNITVWVSDGNLTDSHNWIITVMNVNRQPLIDSFFPVVNPEITEEESQLFIVNASDPDGDNLTIDWYVDGSYVQSGSQYNYSADYDSAGTYDVIAFASDGSLMDSCNWTLTVVNVNRPPTIDSYSPVSDPIITEEGTQSFLINASDPDGDMLYIDWYLDGIPVQPGNAYLYIADYDSAGVHQVEVGISDGNLSVGHLWNLTVTNVNRPPQIVRSDLVGPGLKDLEIQWNISPDDPLTLDHYEVYYGSAYNTHCQGYQLLAVLPLGSTSYVHVDAGNGNPKNFFYCVIAVDQLNVSVSSVDQGAKFIRAVSEGTNLLSVPLMQADEDIEKVLQLLEFDRAWTYDSALRKWKSFVKSKPFRGEFGTLSHTIGFWVNVTLDSNLTVAGVVLRSVKIILRSGWNLVSFPSFQDNYSVADLKAVLNAMSVEGFESSDGPYYLRVLQDSELLNPGYAYWVWVPQNCVWTVSQ